MARKTTRKADFPLGAGAYFSFESTRPEAHSTGTGLEEAQGRLGVKETGVFDDETWRAVKDFQASNDLDVTGLIDAKTWDALVSGGEASTASSDADEK